MASPSNFPTVYMLAVSTASLPLSTYHRAMFPLPLSGPVARKSKSMVHSEYANDRSDHTDPLWFPGAGGVRMMRLERSWGLSGLPKTSKLGM